MSNAESKKTRRLAQAPLQAHFNLVVARRSRFPFDDDSPLVQANVPETREYRVIGVLADREIGQPSDIVSVVFGG